MPERGVVLDSCVRRPDRGGPYGSLPRQPITFCVPDNTPPRPRPRQAVPYGRPVTTAVRVVPGGKVPASVRVVRAQRSLAT